MIHPDFWAGLRTGLILAAVLLGVLSALRLLFWLTGTTP